MSKVNLKLKVRKGRQQLGRRRVQLDRRLFQEHVKESQMVVEERWKTWRCVGVEQMQNDFKV